MSTVSTAANSSKPRRRRWWIGTLITTVLMALTCVGLWRYRAVAIQNDWRSAEMETDALEPRWRLAELEADRPPINDADNAGLQILLAHGKSPKLCVSAVKGYDEIFARLKATIQLNSRQTDLIRDQLDKAQAAITEARKLKDMPRGRFTVRFSLDNLVIQIDGIQPAFDISEWLLHDAYLLAQEERCGEALGNCQAILNVGRTLGDERYLNSHYWRISNQQMATETAERVLAQGLAPEKCLFELQLLIAREMAESNWIGSLKGSRAGDYYCFDNLRTGKLTSNPRPRSWFAAREEMTLWDRMDEKYFHPQRMIQQYPAHLRLMNRVIEIAKLPLHAQKAELKKLIDSKTDDPLGALPSVCMNLHKAELSSQGMLRTTLVGLACERYRLTHHCWPTTLDVLVADKLLPALPTDPVDGQPLRYRHDADGISVYSIGIDEKDNQGNIVRAPLVDQSLRSSRYKENAPGEDVGFRLWNEPRRREVALPPVAIGNKDETVQTDTTPPRMSLYLPIPLGVPGIEKQLTGVFVPTNYKASETIDLIVFLRGYDIKRPKSATSVNEYWNSPEHPILKSFLFREEINKSGKNVVLAVPTLGPFAEVGKLKDAGGIQDFLDRVLEGLWRSGPHAGLANRPTIRHLILAAHSGGGVPLRQLARTLGDDAVYKDKLKECWGFDSLYGVKDKDAEFWSEWAKGHAGTKVRMFYIFTDKAVGKDPKLPVGPNNPLDRRVPTGTTFPSMELERLARARMLDNVTVVRESKVNHNEVPRAHFAELLKAAAYLDDR